MLSMFLQFTVVGIAMGMIYALMAMGLILLIRSVGVLNFAQGNLFMLGAFITYMFGYQIQLDFWQMILASILTFAIFGLIFMFTVWWPVRKSSWKQATIICTIGAASIIKELVNLIWGSIPFVPDPIVTGNLSMGGITLEYQYLVIIAICIVIVMGVFSLFDKVYAGRVMQAAAQDKYAAQLIGIPVTLTIAVTYMIVCTIAGIAGYLVAPIFFVTTSLGTLQLRAFAGVVIGGFGNLKGAVIGSLIIGLIEAYSTFFTSTYKDVFVFMVLILMLVIRPQGIFGERISDKA